jgi:hypothetical protein
MEGGGDCGTRADDAGRAAITESEIAAYREVDVGEDEEEEQDELESEEDDKEEDEEEEEEEGEGAAFCERGGG